MTADMLHFTGDDQADRLLVSDPMALLIGFALDQQVSVQKAFSGPRVLLERLGTLDARALAGLDEATLLAAAKGPPAIHRFPGALTAVLAKQLGVRPPGIEDVLPNHPTLGDVDSPEALADYQAKKRAHKAEMRARES